MTHFPEDDRIPEADRKLLNFLQQYSPQPPLAPAELEDQLFAAIAATPLEQPVSSVVDLASRRKRRNWLMPSAAIAASLVAGLLSYRVLAPHPASQAELASLETFMEDNWHGSVNNNFENDLAIATSSTSD